MIYQGTSHDTKEPEFVLSKVEVMKFQREDYGCECRYCIVSPMLDNCPLLINRIPVHTYIQDGSTSNCMDWPVINVRVGTLYGNLDVKVGTRGVIGMSNYLYSRRDPLYRAHHSILRRTITR